MLENSGESDQTPRSVASNLSSHGLSSSHKKDASIYGLSFCTIITNHILILNPLTIIRKY